MNEEDQEAYDELEKEEDRLRKELNKIADDNDLHKDQFWTLIHNYADNQQELESYCNQ